eukprot:scaffold10736_cov113-Isochrysis_galbana.AAC.1
MSNETRFKILLDPQKPGELGEGGRRRKARAIRGRKHSRDRHAPLAHMAPANFQHGGRIRALPQHRRQAPEPSECPARQPLTGCASALSEA